MHKNGNCSEISAECVSSYCRELIVVELQIPEPYLFYIMMAWPDENNIPEIYEEKLFLMSLRKLNDLLSVKSTAERSDKLNPFFFLAQNIACLDGLNRLCSSKGHGSEGPKKKFLGDVIDRKSIGIKLPSGKMFHVRPSNTYLIRY